MARTFSIHALVILLIVLQLSSYFNTCSASRKTHSNQYYTNKEYIKNSCKATTYPKLCFKALAHHATKIKANPKLLAHAALNTTYFAAKATARLLRDMSKFHGLKPNEAAAMIDCVADISDSVQKLQKSAKEMDRAEGSEFDQVQLNDIQMWVNTALEEEETCMNALANKNIKHKVKHGVRRRIIKVAHLTSNALALVKSSALAKKNSP